MVTHGRGRPTDRARPSNAQDDPPREGGFAYVLLSHVDPEAVLRSVRRIRELSPTAHVLVRHAQGPGFLDELHAAAAGAEVLVSRTPIRWGTFSTVAAVLEALAEAERRWQPSHTVVVSGQDHPVRDLQAWEDGVRRTGADGLLRQDHRRYDERHAYRWHALPEALDRWRPLLAGAARATRSEAVRRFVRVEEAGGRTWVVGHARRSRPPVPYRKGTLWMTLSHRAVARLLSVEEATRRFFATTLIPDEAFVHSVLAATPGLRVVDGVTSAAFFPPEGGPHPRTVLAGDVTAVLTGGAAFARKVVAGHSDEFVRLVDAAVDADRTRTTTPAAATVVERTAP